MMLISAARLNVSHLGNRLVKSNAGEMMLAARFTDMVATAIEMAPMTDTIGLSWPQGHRPGSR